MNETGKDRYSMAGIGKKVEGAAKRAAKGKATGGGKSTGGKKGKSTGGSGAAKAKKAARDLLK